MKRRSGFQLMRPLLVALVLVALASIMGSWHAPLTAYGKAADRASGGNGSIVMNIDTIGSDTISSLQLKMSVSAPTTTGGTGIVQVSSVVVSKNVSQLTPLIVNALVSGTHIPAVTFSFYDAAGNNTKTIVLNDVLIIKHWRYASNTMDTEQDTFRYGQIIITAGGITTVYNVDHHIRIS